MGVTIISTSVSKDLTQALGFEEEIGRVQDVLCGWIEGSDGEVRSLLGWQFLGDSKYFRPLTIFACHRAVSDKPVGNALIRSAAALELIHNVSLIIDDILDRSRYRRRKLTLHCRFGSLPALMTAGYIAAAAFEMVSKDSYGVNLLAKLLERLGVAECLQWRLRRHPLGVEDWRYIAGEDTGSMFETCACLGTRDETLRSYGRLLGMLYHGCDDVGDVRGATALGGGGDEDLRDGILTLPAALAIRDPEAAVLFRKPTATGLKVLLGKMEASLGDAEKYLDGIAEEAIAQAKEWADNPKPLLTLVHYTRFLSRA